MNFSEEHDYELLMNKNFCCCCFKKNIYLLYLYSFRFISPLQTKIPQINPPIYRMDHFNNSIFLVVLDLLGFLF
jgi:hypothetical protein